MPSRVELRIGVGQADITPAKGIQIAGDIGRYRPVEEIRDPLFAKAMVLENGRERFCWVTVDVLSVSRKWANVIKREAARRHGLNADTTLVHVLQNHAAPAVGHFFVFDEDAPGLFPREYPWLLGGDERYNAAFVEGVMQAIARAADSVQPVTVRIGRGIDGRVAFNRRFVMRDGTVRTHPPLCHPDILHAEGPADPEVGVMTFTAGDGRPVAAVLHHTCHPVHGYPMRWVSAGWPGAWSDGVRALLGSDCVVMVTNGFCGNIHHRNHTSPDNKEDYQDMGRKLTETVSKVLPGLAEIDAPRLGAVSRSLQIPLRLPEPHEVDEARRLLAAHPEPVWKDAAKTAVEWDWVYAATRIDLDTHVRRTPFFDYPVQVFRVGSMALVAVPGEPFVEEQLRVKLASPAAFTFMAHMSNTYVGYIPTPQAFARGGYETRTGAGSKLAPEALGMIGDAAIAMLKNLFGQGPGDAGGRA